MAARALQDLLQLLQPAAALSVAGSVVEFGTRPVIQGRLVFQVFSCLTDLCRPTPASCQVCRVMRAHLAHSQVGERSHLLRALPRQPQRARKVCASSCLPACMADLINTAHLQLWSGAGSRWPGLQ